MIKIKNKGNRACQHISIFPHLSWVHVQYFHRASSGNQYCKWNIIGIPFSFQLWDPNTCEVNTKYKAVRTSIYTKHLERWLKYFPIEQFHIVDGDRLITEPLPELQLVEKFLNLPPRISQYNLYFNATRGFYCLRFNIIFNKCLAGSKGRIHPEVDPSVITKLRKFFHPFNQKFYQITGRTLNWP